MNWLFLALGIVPTALISLVLHNAEIDHLKAKQENMLIAQQAADKHVCDSDKAITKEANDALQKDHDDIAVRYAQLVQQPAACVPVSQPAQLSGSGSAGHAKPNGVSDQWLRAYAAECEGYRREVTTCVNYINHLPR